MIRTIAAILALTVATPAMADGFQVIGDRGSFIQLIKDRQLKRFGITLQVSPDGRIQGRAFGKPVTGAWDWNGRYFCRDLFYGEQNLGQNCQLVQLRGQTIRFTSDQGTGDSADLRLE